MQDYHRQLDKEKETYRARLSEQENKAKEAEKLRSQHMFEYEKERAKWQLEKDSLACKIQELEDQVDKLVHQKESLMKENTRMKVESKASSKRNPSYSATANNGVGQSQAFSAGMMQHVLLQHQQSNNNLNQTATTLQGVLNSSQANFHNTQQTAGASSQRYMMAATAKTPQQ